MVNNQANLVLDDVLYELVCSCAPIKYTDLAKNIEVVKNLEQRLKCNITYVELARTLNRLERQGLISKIRLEGSRFYYLYPVIARRVIGKIPVYDL